MFTERELVAKIVSGNVKAFELLIKRYEKLVLHMVSKMISCDEDVHDVCQDVFIKVYHQLHTFSFQSKLSTWIARIAYFTTINHLRKVHREQLRITNDDLLAIENNYFTEETPEQLLIKKDASAYIQHLVQQLPLAYRSVLTLFYLEEFSYQEIQEVTGMPEGTVKNYIFRAKKLLREKLAQYVLLENKL
ncbi:sigma-70 family RNA polymerase sigma factor [Olivibacter ginsenosidimutans]|uniref:Sigma-70 family RNA polymerase sigma factor n=1 Tax=Olivibacter ginsenosidimutans TaxID=1176537 RepID=A0ABP9BZS1_9SPHI